MLLCYKNTTKPLQFSRFSLIKTRSHAVFVGSRIANVPQLASWDIKCFREQAFVPEAPAKLPYSQQQLPNAFAKWFIHGGNAAKNLDKSSLPPPALNIEFWSQYEDLMVPLELTTASTSSPYTTFYRSEAPLKILLDHLSTRFTSDCPTEAPENASTHSQGYSIYLAQCDLTSLPSALQDDLPTPEIVRSSGKGDIYSSSLWLGRPPTYTPLHRDPNPNLFLQLAGEKVIRLLPPSLGDAIFEDVQEQLANPPPPPTTTTTTTNTASKNANQDFNHHHHHHHGHSGSSTIRGEEMMQGPEKQLLHDTIWGAETGTTTITRTKSHNDTATLNKLVTTYGLEAHVKAGEALFIPKRWWHSVKGVGDGVTASVNWWFR